MLSMRRAFIFSTLIIEAAVWAAPCFGQEAPRLGHRALGGRTAATNREQRPGQVLENQHQTEHEADVS